MHFDLVLQTRQPEYRLCSADEEEHTHYELELEGEQKRHYDELRDHYRSALLGRIRKGGIDKSRMQILEALLRLRQAACHPALIDPNADDESAKTELLMDELRDVLDSGHRALVFSQFTSFLAIVRRETGIMAVACLVILFLGLRAAGTTPLL